MAKNLIAGFIFLIFTVFLSLFSSPSAFAEIFPGMQLAQNGVSPTLSNEQKAERFENLRHYVRRHCPLVDKELSETIDPKIENLVFNTCRMGTVVSILNGCSVPCGNESAPAAEESVDRAPQTERRSPRAFH